MEVPSTEGPRYFDAVLEEAERLGVRVHRVSQGAASSCTRTRNSTRCPLAPRPGASRSRCSRGRTPRGERPQPRGRGRRRIRVDSPVYVEFGLRNAPDVYPAGSHLEATTVALSRERVRRARLGLDILARSSYPAVMSEFGAEGPAVPLAA